MVELHPDGELATAKGTDDANATMVLSTFPTVTNEEVAAATTGPLWFQLYVQPDREFTRELARRAEAAGYQALVVTIDTSVFRSTRVSARTLLDYLDSGFSRDEFLEFFPRSGARTPATF